MKEFYIGWHQPVNGRSGCGGFSHCMISVNRLLNRKSPFQVNKWVLDNGAFTRLINGNGHLPADTYAAEINRWSSNGQLMAAASQDWLCDAEILRVTGLTVAEHQQLTIERYDALLKLVDKAYVMPVLQGYAPQEYVGHIEQYGDRLRPGQWVGVGSVCKRNSSPGQVEAILMAIKSARPDLQLHGFGLKMKALQSSIVWDCLHSADSQAAIHIGGRGKKKYVNSNNPATALAYAAQIKQPDQLSIFSSPALQTTII